MRIPFGTESYAHRSRPVASQRMVNCYLEPSRNEGFAAVTESHGVDAFASPGNGMIRGGYVVNDIPYVVCGQVLYRVNRDGTSTELGTVPGLGLVDIAGDETNLMIVTNPDAYYWNGSEVAQVISAGYPGAEWVEYLDGYFIVGKPNSQQFYVSGNRDPNSWDALDFASAEKSPDNLVGAIVDHAELILFGRDSGEVWYNSGNADFPLDRASSGQFEVGMLSRFGAAKKDNSVFFPGSDGVVYRLNGYSPQRISTHAVEQAIERSADKNFRGFTWTEGGHAFYALRSETFCFVYDISTNLWHERESYAYPTWRVMGILRAYDSWLALDSREAKVGKLHENTFTEWGDVLRASATSPAISAENREVFHVRLELVFETGVGTLSGQGEAPMVMLRWSDDSGRTWSNEKWLSLGALGSYQTRCIKYLLGKSRNRIYEYSVSDPVRRTLVMATLETDAGTY